MHCNYSERKNQHIEHIFIDESGDLGAHGSKYFVIVALSTHNPLELRRIMKRLRERKLGKKLKEIPEIKANNSNERIRTFVLKRIGTSSCSISACAIPKVKIRADLLEQQGRFYNYLCGMLLEQISLNANHISVVIDKKYNNQLLRDNFNQYMTEKIKSKTTQISISIRHMESHVSQELQAVDFVAWAVHRKFTFGDSSYYDIIKHKIENGGNEEKWE